MSAFASFTKKVHTEAYPEISPALPALSCANKTVVVVGASKGIGREIAIYFGRAGAKSLVLTARSEDSLREVKSVVETENGSSSLSVAPTVVHTYAVSSTDEAAMKTTLGDVREKIGPIDVLVYSAGFMSHGLISKVDIPDYWRNYEVNVLGGLITLQGFIANAAPENATFINISSAAGHLGSPQLSAYSTSKLAFAKIMMLALTEVEKEGLLKNFKTFSIQPGVIETDMQKRSGRPARDNIDLPASFCVWLASPASDFVNGRFLWSNWDVTELKSRAEEIKSKDLLKIKLDGWDTYPGMLRHH